MEDYVPVDVLRERLSNVDDVVLQGKLSKALAILSRCFALYRPDQIALSFNGGKDSTVLLHLLRLAIDDLRRSQRKQQSGGGDGAAHGSSSNSGGEELGGVRSFYFERADDFPEVRAFVRSTDAAYRLGCRFLGDPDFNAGLRDYLDQTRVAAVVLGTRRGDPNAEGQEAYCPSSEGWPPFMRVNPVLDWTYHDVWCFLRSARASYCSLYDDGYTSLGGVHNTLPNSALKRGDGTFAPAHALADGRLERAGRATKARRAESLPATPADVEPCITLRAGIVVVGDEILSGKVNDANTPYLCRELRAIGWTVSKVVVVPDEVASIAREVAALSADADAVLTSGGVGPTLDDVTVEGVAAAFGTCVVRHPDIEESLAAFFGRDLTEAHLKMAETPGDFTTLLSPQVAPATAAATTDAGGGGAGGGGGWDGGGWDGGGGGAGGAGGAGAGGGGGGGGRGAPSPFPIVKTNNVYMLPGVPHLLQRKWPRVRAELEDMAQLSPFANRVFRLGVADEAAVAPLLDTLSLEFGGDVAIGSYPVTGERDGARLLLTLESKRAAALAPAAARLRELLPAGALLGEQRDVARLLLAAGEGGSSPGRRAAPTAADAAAVTASASAVAAEPQQPQQQQHQTPGS